MSAARRVAFRAVAVLLLAGWPTLAQARQPEPGGVEVRASIEPRETSVVEPVVLTLEVVAPAGAVVDDPSPALEPGGTVGGLTIASVRREPPRLHEDGHRLVVRWVVTLEPYLPGEVRLPPISVLVTPASGEPSRGVAEEIDITVRPVMEEGATFEAGLVRPPLGPPEAVGQGNGIGLWAALAGGVACMGLGAAGAWAVRPSPARRVRRSFRVLEKRARAAAGMLEPAERGRVAVAVVREGLAMVVGHRARSATPQELAALLVGVGGVGREEAGRVLAEAARLEHQEYAGSHAPAPEDPPTGFDPLPILVALRQAAVRAALAVGGKSPSSEALAA